MAGFRRPRCAPLVTLNTYSLDNIAAQHDFRELSRNILVPVLERHTGLVDINHCMDQTCCSIGQVVAMRSDIRAHGIDRVNQLLPVVDNLLPDVDIKDRLARNYSVAIYATDLLVEAAGLHISQEDIMAYFRQVILPKGILRFQVPAKIDEDVVLFSYLDAVFSSCNKELGFQLVNPDCTTQFGKSAHPAIEVRVREVVKEMKKLKGGKILENTVVTQLKSLGAQKATTATARFGSFPGQRGKVTKSAFLIQKSVVPSGVLQRLYTVLDVQPQQRHDEIEDDWSDEEDSDSDHNDEEISGGDEPTHVTSSRDPDPDANVEQESSDGDDHPMGTSSREPDPDANVVQNHHSSAEHADEDEDTDEETDEETDSESEAENSALKQTRDSFDLQSVVPSKDPNSSDEHDSEEDNTDEQLDNEKETRSSSDKQGFELQSVVPSQVTQDSEELVTRDDMELAEVTVHVGADTEVCEKLVCAKTSDAQILVSDAEEENILEKLAPREKLTCQEETLRKVQKKRRRVHKETQEEQTKKKKKGDKESDRSDLEAAKFVEVRCELIKGGKKGSVVRKLYTAEVLRVSKHEVCVQYLGRKGTCTYQRSNPDVAEYGTVSVDCVVAVLSKPTQYRQQMRFGKKELQDVQDHEECALD